MQVFHFVIFRVTVMLNLINYYGTFYDVSSVMAFDQMAAITRQWWRRLVNDYEVRQVWYVYSVTTV